MPHEAQGHVNDDIAGHARRPHNIAESRSRGGTVALVGAGPGDPDFLTVRGARLIAQADVVLVDALVDPRTLALCRRDARVLDVGKQPGGPTTSQERINEMLVHEASAGAFVVRLKGGDPFVFGRGGEEVIALAEAGIPCEVVPGLSSALAVPALAGIPLTHRSVSTSFTVLTGTLAVGDDADTWRAAARTSGTLVFLMAVHALERIVEALLEARSPTEPVAIIENGTQLGERVTITTLERLAIDARANQVASPAVIVVGAVVSLREAAEVAIAVAVTVGTGSVDVSL